jgi:hypothetical protein
MQEGEQFYWYNYVLKVVCSFKSFICLFIYLCVLKWHFGIFQVWRIVN